MYLSIYLWPASQSLIRFSLSDPGVKLGLLEFIFRSFSYTFGLILYNYTCTMYKIDVLVTKLEGLYQRIYNYIQSWARIPAGPSRDACLHSFISSLRSVFPRALSKLFFRVPRFAFPRSRVPNFASRSCFALFN